MTDHIRLWRINLMLRNVIFTIVCIITEIALVILAVTDGWPMMWFFPVAWGILIIGGIIEIWQESKRK